MQRRKAKSQRPAPDGYLVKPEHRPQTWRLPSRTVSPCALKAHDKLNFCAQIKPEMSDFNLTGTSSKCRVDKRSAMSGQVYWYRYWFIQTRLQI